MNVRVLKFHVQIPNDKIVDPYFFHVKVMRLFMPPTLKKLEGHIAFALPVCLCVAGGGGGCVC